jgi:hypothetical protein
MPQSTWRTAACSPATSPPRPAARQSPRNAISARHGRSRTASVPARDSYWRECGSSGSLHRHSMSRATISATIWCMSTKSSDGGPAAWAFAAVCGRPGAFRRFAANWRCSARMFSARLYVGMSDGSMGRSPPPAPPLSGATPCNDRPAFPFPGFAARAGAAVGGLPLSSGLPGDGPSLLKGGITSAARSIRPWFGFALLSVSFMVGETSLPGTTRHGKRTDRATVRMPPYV